MAGIAAEEKDECCGKGSKHVWLFVQKGNVNIISFAGKCAKDFWWKKGEST